MAPTQAEMLFDRLRSCRDLPTPPAVALRIIDLAQDPLADLARSGDDHGVGLPWPMKGSSGSSSTHAPPSST